MCKELQWLPQGHTTKENQKPSQSPCVLTRSPHLMQPTWEHSTFIPKSSVLTGIVCHLFLSSQSTHCFLYRQGCMHSLGWESGSWSGCMVRFGWCRRRNCAGSSKPSSFCQPSWETSSLAFPIPVTMESWHGWLAEVDWASFPISLCLWHIISAAWLPASL